MNEFPSTEQPYGAVDGLEQRNLMSSLKTFDGVVLATLIILLLIPVARQLAANSDIYQINLICLMLNKLMLNFGFYFGFRFKICVVSRNLLEG